MRSRIVLMVMWLVLSGCAGKKTSDVYQESRVSGAEDMATASAPIYEAIPAPAPVMPVPKEVTGNDHIALVGGEHSDNSIIMSHAYTVVSTEAELEGLQDILTFVILPYDLSTQELGKDSPKYRRYKKVLELIQQMQEVENRTPKGSFKYKGKNKFVVMSKEGYQPDGNQTVQLKSYNYKLANSVLDFFRTYGQSSVFNKEGPFLITTTKNVLTQKDKPFSFLYLNLSTFNNSAIEQVIESYKNRLVEEGLEGVGILEQWHYSLLSLVTNFNADMHIVQSAVAGEL